MTKTSAALRASGRVVTRVAKRAAKPSTRRPGRSVSGCPCWSTDLVTMLDGVPRFHAIHLRPDSSIYFDTRAPFTRGDLLAWIGRGKGHFVGRYAPRKSDSSTILRLKLRDGKTVKLERPETYSSDPVFGKVMERPPWEPIAVEAPFGRDSFCISLGGRTLICDPLRNLDVGCRVVNKRSAEVGFVMKLAKKDAMIRLDPMLLLRPGAIPSASGDWKRLPRLELARVVATAVSEDLRPLHFGWQPAGERSASRRAAAVGGRDV